MINLHALIAFRRRVGLIEQRLRTLLEIHETSRLACNDLLAAYDYPNSPADLEPLPNFVVQDRIETEPSATQAVLVVLGSHPNGATVDVITAQVKKLAPHCSEGSVLTAISRLTAKGAIWGRRGKGAVYRLGENATIEAGHTRRRRQQPVSKRVHPRKVADPADFNAAAAFLLVLHGPMTGPDLLVRLKDKLKPSGKYDLKYLESNLGKDPGIVSTDFGYWLAGLPLPEREEAIRRARVKGSRSPAPNRDAGNPIIKEKSARAKRPHEAG